MKRRAFTLIEMLVVIAIIGILAALVVNLIGGATASKRNALANVLKSKYTQLIDNYQSKLNFYPADNGLVSSYSSNYNSYELLTATNPLIYELTGATNSSTGIQIFNGTNIPVATFSGYYNRVSVANSSTEEPHNFFRSAPQQRDMGYYNATDGLDSLQGLIVPMGVSDNATNLNFWHYDASSPNRHNRNGYDLWAEYSIGSKNGVPIIATNGNW